MFEYFNIIHLFLTLTTSTAQQISSQLCNLLFLNLYSYGEQMHNLPLSSLPKALITETLPGRRTLAAPLKFVTVCIKNK